MLIFYYSVKVSHSKPLQAPIRQTPSLDTEVILLLHSAI